MATDSSLTIRMRIGRRGLAGRRETVIGIALMVLVVVAALLVRWWHR